MSICNFFRCLQPGIQREEVDPGQYGRQLLPGHCNTFTGQISLCSTQEGQGVVDPLLCTCKPIKTDVALFALFSWLVSNYSWTVSMVVTHRMKRVRHKFLSRISFLGASEYTNMAISNVYDNSWRYS
jgi:hypothetical protein